VIAEDPRQEVRWTITTILQLETTTGDLWEDRFLFITRLHQQITVERGEYLLLLLRIR
jgi:hypothetical protein